MIRDFRPTDLETVHTQKATHRLEITHKATGVRVSGTGENRYALECQLLELLDKKLRAREATREDIQCLQ